LFETLDYGFGLGYETIFMNTNGTLMTEEISRKLAGYSGFSISVSLDGPERLHERIRGKGSYIRTMRGIERALKGGNNVTIFTTVTKSLVPELPLFTDDLYKKFPTIDSLILIQLIRTGNGAFPLSGELLEPEDFIQLVRIVALLNVGGFRTIVKKNPLANVISKKLGMPWIPPVPPLYREGRMTIMSNRHIGVVHSNRNSFGRYRPGMIGKVLASDGYRRTVAPDQATCPSCRYVCLCRKSGIIRPSEGHRDLDIATPYCRRVLDLMALVQPNGRDNPGRQEAGLLKKACTQDAPDRDLLLFDRRALRGRSPYLDAEACLQEAHPWRSGVTQRLDKL
jgi:MoaA/NifB/PqqE/SkfB family radical SAM enzyme